MRLFLIAAMAVFFSGAANAGVLTFDQLECGYNPPSGPDQGVTWSSYNHNTYGYCEKNLLLGDDGWSKRATINGNNFSVQSFDWSGNTFITDPTVPFVSIEGYRDNKLVAYDVISVGNMSPGGWGTSGSGTRHLDNFVDLDTLRFTLLQSMDRYSPACIAVVPSRYQQCGYAKIDNVVINSISPVPLPASGVLLGFGLLGFGFLKRRKSVA
ncbi:MAG: VPLPA-CTERM sorting domain-containing protein [Marinosulfonomonas sp.]